jgi:hypothetical protein
MGTGVSFYVRNLVAKEMRERIATAKRQGEPLMIPEAAAQIAEEYPGSAVPEEDLRNRLFAEAANAGVAADLRATRLH